MPAASSFLCQPTEPIVFFYSTTTRSIFSTPLTPAEGSKGDVNLYYIQSPLFKDEALSQPVSEGYLSFQFTIHTIDGRELPYTDQLSVFTKDGNLTAFANEDTTFFAINSEHFYEIAEAQGAFNGKSHVILRVDADNLRTVIIL